MAPVHRSLARALVFLLFLGIPRATSAALDLDENIYRHKKLGVRLAIPDRWSPSTQTGYPSLLLLLFEPTGATLSVAAATLPNAATLGQYVADNNQGLRKFGLLVLATRPAILGGRSVVEVTARREDATREIRQVYLAQGSRVFVVTLCAAPTGLAALLADLQALIRALEI